MINNHVWKNRYLIAKHDFKLDNLTIDLKEKLIIIKKQEYILSDKNYNWFLSNESKQKNKFNSILLNDLEYYINKIRGGKL